MSRDLHRRSVRIEHGPREAYYSTLPDAKPHPVIQCLCGWFPETISDTWEQVGEAFDAHIASALRADAPPVAPQPSRARRTAKDRP